MLRRRMNKLINILEDGGFSKNRDIVLSDRYRKALLALEHAGCVRILRAWGGGIVRVQLLNSHVGYQLSRSDLWLNRVWGFLAGVATSVTAHYVIVLVELWRASR